MQKRQRRKFTEFNSPHNFHRVFLSGGVTSNHAHPSPFKRQVYGVEIIKIKVLI